MRGVTFLLHYFPYAKLRKALISFSYLFARPYGKIRLPLDDFHKI
jgi:hypothetical protein